MSKTKIAILGGGMSALTAAWLLSLDADQYDITVYQLGWRIGGKTATGRGKNQRIEEHGIHVMQGWYDNAFRLLRGAYEERTRLNLDPDNPIRTWEQSVTGTNVMSMPYYASRSRKWLGWTLVFPTNSDPPGGPPIPFIDLVKEGLVLTFEVLFGFQPEPMPGPVPPSANAAATATATPLDDARRIPRDVSSDSMARWVVARLNGKRHLLKRPTKEDAKAALKELIDGVGAPEDTRVTIDGKSAHPAEHLVSFFEDLLKWLRRIAHAFEKAILDVVSLMKRVLKDVIVEVNEVLDAVLAALNEIAPFGTWLDHIILLIDFVVVNLRGLFATVYNRQTRKFDFSLIDKYDYREWLLMNGGNKALVDSVIVRFFYTGTFSNLYGGDGGLLSAAVAVRGLLTFIGYKTAPVFLLTAGTGDTLVMPIYQVLQNRGVKFKFFRQVEAVIPGSNGEIDGVRLGRQVDLKDPNTDYQPTIKTGPAMNITAWPNRPLYGQINAVQADELIRRDINLEDPWSGWTNVGTETLQRGRDFDMVLLGIPVGALQHCCAEIIEAQPRWQNMVRNIKTTATQAMTIWAKPTMEELGLFRSAAKVPRAQCPVGCVTYSNGQFSWGDYSCTLWSESWPVDNSPRTTIQFGGALPDITPIPPFSDHGYPARMKERVVGANVQWLVGSGSFFWPTNTNPEIPESFDLQALVAPDMPNGSGMDKLLSQYFHAAVFPQDRFTLSVPGSSQYRLRAGDSGYTNLVLTGDWIDYGMNAGYVEGAVISGHEAARAICLKLGKDNLPQDALRHPDVVW